MSDVSFFRVHFNNEKYYEFVIDEQGPIVYSECCADRMTPEVARQVRDALTKYLTGDWSE